MTLKEFFESNQLLAVHLKTKEQSIIFSKEADKLGKKWSSGASYVECNFWDEYEGKTCYTNRGCFSFISHYENSDENLQCKILNFEDIEWGKEKMNNFTKEDIKNGAIVELRNGEHFIKIDSTLLKITMTGIYLPLKLYNNDLTYKNSDFDIMRVLNPRENEFYKEACNKALFDFICCNVKWTWEREEKKKIKLKDLTPEQYENWKNEHCCGSNCKNCIFYKVSCGAWSGDCWINNKEVYSENFLNQEIEIEEE